MVSSDARARPIAKSGRSDNEGRKEWESHKWRQQWEIHEVEREGEL